MWKIKDPAIKEKIMQLLLSDESIAKRCNDQMDDGSSYILLYDDDENIRLRLDKERFEKVPEYNPDDWNPFPQVTPKSESVFLVTTRVPTGETTVTVSQYTNYLGWMLPSSLDVIAFREYPKPHKVEK